MSDLWSSSTPSSTPSPIPSSTPSPMQSSSIQSNSPPVQQQSGSDLVYTGLATYGLFRALIGAIIGSCIGLLFIFAGVMQLFATPPTMVNATITSINSSTTSACQPTTQTVGNKSSITYNCTLGVSFTYSGQTYNVLVQYNGTTNYVIGQVIPVYFTTDPNNVSLSGIKPSDGWFLIIIGIGIIVFACAMYYAARKWKAIAAIEGGEYLLNSYSNHSSSYDGGGGNNFNMNNLLPLNIL